MMEPTPTPSDARRLTAHALEVAQTAEAAAWLRYAAYPMQREAFLEGLRAATHPATLDLDAVRVFSDGLDALDRVVGRPAVEAYSEATAATRAAQSS